MWPLLSSRKSENCNLSAMQTMCRVMFQVVIVPCGITAQMTPDDRKRLIDRCQELSTSLKAAGILVKDDFRDNYSPGWKFNHWELKVK